MPGITRSTDYSSEITTFGIPTVPDTLKKKKVSFSYNVKVREPIDRSLPARLQAVTGEFPLKLPLGFQHITVLVLVLILRKVYATYIESLITSPLVL